jgi:hypothetical protein
MFSSRDVTKADISLIRHSIDLDEIMDDDQIQEKVLFIFDKIFQPYFDFNQNQNKSLISNDDNNQILTWNQFEDAVNNNSQDQEKTSINLLR